MWLLYVLLCVGAVSPDSVLLAPPPECFVDDDCRDELWCNGEESCMNGTCITYDPCPDLLCDEYEDECVQCFVDADCSDGLWCSGLEACISGNCFPGSDPCPGLICDEQGEQCVECMDDGDCNNGLRCVDYECI